ncbi:hypothetical protein FOMG_19365 [Fusarium oxysporum f. sp. melonis 26406]|uniref:Uncharacterized protein n=1 Tax=Fusarium oxysporum f. sp. melonis 26406 TaxID=1089452 RepID=W9YWE3_FUSOX|nr:hypothetical protein FOMG_19365 [Fusarium oxysporum f. sp. melonis 26406]
MSVLKLQEVDPNSDTPLILHVLAATCQPGLQDFRNPGLFFQAKNTKLLFKSPDAPRDLLAVMSSFDCKLRRILTFSHICSDRLYIDIGKETCPVPDGVPSPNLRHTSGGAVVSATTSVSRSRMTNTEFPIY